MGVDALLGAGREATVEVGGKLFLADRMAAESEKPHGSPPLLRSPAVVGLQTV
jgi:hypothetical protein